MNFDAVLLIGLLLGWTRPDLYMVALPTQPITPGEILAFDDDDTMTFDDDVEMTEDG